MIIGDLKLNKNRISRKQILLVDSNPDSSAEIIRILESSYDLTVCDSAEQAINHLKENPPFVFVFANLNLHPKDASLMDGFSIARFCAHSDSDIPIGVYTADLHPLAVGEAKSYGVFKIFDQSQPDFQRSLLTTINYALKIQDWKTKFWNDLVYSTRIQDLLDSDSFMLKPFVSRIKWNFSDENLYQCFFGLSTHENYCYANSWAYICQAARCNGYKFFNGSCLITFCAKETADSANVQFEIVNPIGQAAIKRTLELAEMLKMISGNPVSIKKISEQQEKHFLESKKCKKMEIPKSRRLEDYFDDIYPQVVVNLKAYMDLIFSDPKLARNRRNIKKFSEREYSSKITAPELFEDFLDIVYKWKRSFISRYEQREEFTDIPQHDDYYINPYFSLFEYFSKKVDQKNILSSLIYVDTIPVGFSLLTRVSPICMAMYANLGDTDFDGLAEFMLHHNIERAYWAGYKYLNLGGTESRFLYEFYKHYAVSTENEKSFEIKTNYLIYE